MDMHPACQPFKVDKRRFWRVFALYCCLEARCIQGKLHVSCAKGHASELFWGTPVVSVFCLSLTRQIL